MKTTFSFAFIMLCTITVSTYGVPPDMVLIPGGEFLMGDFFNEGYWGWDELPVHSVQLDPFCIGQYEVTNQQYCEFLNSAFSQSLVEVKTDNVVYRVGTSTPYCALYVPGSSRISRIAFDSSGFYIVPSDKADHPVVLVTWYGAAAYTNWRSEQEGKEPCYDLSTWECNFSQNGYRLPTEAEWEYSARGGLAGMRYPWGNTLEPGRANYVSSGDPYECGAEPHTTPVGYYNGQMRQKSDFGWPCAQDTYQTLDGANGFGLYDMAGNVFEWCNDWFDPYFYRITPYPHINPTGPTGSVYGRVLRGGDWAQPGGPPEGCRVSNRIALDLSFRDHTIGFRVVYIPELIINSPPVAVCQDVMVEAGSGCVAEASVDSGSYDPDGDAITITQDPPGPYSLGTTTVTLTVTDSHGASDSCTATVTVEDTTPPIIVEAIVSPQVVEVGQTVSFDAMADDECDLTAQWDFGDGAACPGLSATHAYSMAGIYTATLTVTDTSDNSATEEFFVVVYDPSAGFVTGGGWIWSSEGAFADNPSSIGKANFGFVSKYKQGATVPTGQTEIVFQAGDLNFHSSGYDWLVVTGSNYARFKGTGTINGSGAYKFMLWAGDDEPDTFRIRIWVEDELANETVVYDNGFNQPIGGGSIIVHTD